MSRYYTNYKVLIELIKNSERRKPELAILTTRRRNQNSWLSSPSRAEQREVEMFLSSWMTYQRRREREKIATAKIQEKYAVS